MILEMRKLIDKLNKWTKLYDKGVPEVSDKEWDDNYFELEKLEKEMGVIYPDSPTQKIIYQTVSKLNKVKHNHLMLSLDKSKDIKDIENFLKGHEWLAMFKLDGLTVSLTYENGELIKAETRGDGYEGEDVLHNILVMDTVPKQIPNKEKTVIDGEVICDYLTFSEFEGEFKNPRNLAAGAIRCLSSKESASRKLSFIAWDLIEGIDEDSFMWRLEKLDDWGFTTVPRVGDAETVEDAIGILDNMEIEKELYPIDGYVFKFESKSYGESLGHTGHHFRNAIAYKFYDELYETKLKYITYDVSRNGVLTPVAVFEPIEIDGTAVEKSSLHNMSIMKEVLGKTPYCGEIVWVYKANQIIPQIAKANKMEYGDIISHGGVTTGLGGDYGVLCPVCGGLTSIHTSDSGVEILMCDNPTCEGKLAQRIDHFFGIKGLNVKGISRKTIEKLIDWGWVNSIKDIYHLHSHQMEWMSKEGFGKASVFKILDAIDEVGRHPSLESFISALGIPLVGKTVAKQIVKYYPTWEDFRAAVGGDWTEFDGFGPEINNAINNFDYTEADEIVAEVEFKQPEIQNNEVSATAAGLTFCITGKLKTYKNREEFKSHIESIGGKVVGSMSSKVNYLINNDSTSSSAKNKAAKDAGIPIITEEEFKEKFDN